MSTKYVAALVALTVASCGGGSGGSSTVAPTTLNYLTDDETYEACADITDNTATVNGSPITTWSVDPALPSGLVLDAVDGRITGAPDAVVADAAYTVTAANAAGSIDAILMIETTAPPVPAGLSYTTSDATYSTNTAITPNTPSVTAGNVTSYAIAPALPAGLDISPTSGVISGTPSAVTADTSYTVTASDCLGSSTTTSITIEVIDGGPPTPSSARFAYTANVGDGTLSSYVLDTDSGRLRHSGFTSIGGAPQQLAVSADSDELFVLDGTNDEISILGINPASGELAESASSPVAIAAGSGAIDMLASADGSKLYIANGALNSISVYDVAANGDLTALVGSPFALTATNPVSLALAPAGDFLLVACTGTSELVTLAVAGDGSLSGEQRFAVTNGAVAVGALERDDDTLVAYVGTGAGNSVVPYTIDGTGAATALTEPDLGISVDFVKAVEFSTGDRVLYVMSQSDDIIKRVGILPATGQSTGFLGETAEIMGADPVAIALSSDGARAAVAFGGDNELSSAASDIDDNGRLAAAFLGTLPVDRSRARAGLADVVLVDGAAPTFATTNLYAANFDDDDASQYTYADAAGDLTALAPATVAAGEGPNWIAVHPSLEKAYVVNAGDTVGADIQTFDLGAGGALTGTPTDTDIGIAGAASTGAWSIHVGPSGRFAIAVRGDAASDLISYPIDATGALGVGQATVGGPTARGGVIDPSERFFYVANSGDGTVSTFAIDPTTFALTAVGTATAADTGAWACDVDPSGRFLYVVNRGAGTVSGFAIAPADGSLTAINSFATASTPADVLVENFGRYVYVANEGATEVSRYIVNLNPGNANPDGSLVGLAAFTVGGNGRSLALDADGDALLMSLSDTGDVISMAIDTATGTLTLSDTEASSVNSTRGIATRERVQ